MADKQTTTQTSTETQTTEGAGETLSRDELNEMMEKKISAHLTRFKGALSKDFEGAIAKAISPLAEQFSAIAKPDGDAKDVDQAQAKYEARIKEMEAKFEAERTAREAEQHARVEQERRTALSNALAAEGVTGPHLKAALATIYDAQKLVVHDDKGQIGIRFQRAGYEDIMPIDAGIKELLKSADYQIFLPPRPAAGSGTVPGAAPKSGPHKMTKEEAMRMLIPAVLKASQ